MICDLSEKEEGMSKEIKIKPIYSDLTIRLYNIAKIKKLVSECIKLRILHGFKDIKEDNMLIISLEMYERSIKKRIRNKAEKNPNDLSRDIRKEGVDND